MIAMPDDWKRLPFGQMAPIPYQACFSDAEYDKIAQGLVPQMMEDKWFAYLNDAKLCFHRSWTGQAVYSVALQSSAGLHVVKEALCAVEIIEKSDARYESEILDFLISNLLLGHTKPFPRPASLTEPMKGLYQHAIAGTGYQETTVARKRWWRFWS